MASAQSPNHLNHPDSWVTGNDAPTEKQKSFLNTLASDKGVEVDTSSLNKSQASTKIDTLKNMESQSEDGGSTAEKPIRDPNEWSTGEDPATGKQMGYIAVMAKEAGEQVPGSMGKSDASKKIEELKSKTGM